jgi:hypothetical protein
VRATARWRWSFSIFNAAILTFCNHLFAWSGELANADPFVAVSAAGEVAAKPEVAKSAALRTVSASWTGQKNVKVQVPADPAAKTPLQIANIASDQTSAPDVSSLDGLTNKSLRKLIEIQKLSNRFRMETALVSRWRQRRVFLYGETQASCTEAGLIAQLPVRYKLKHEKRPKNVPGSVELDTEEEIDEISSDNGQPINNANVVQRGHERGKLAWANEITLVGQSFGTAGDIFELGLNYANYLRIRREGLTPALYHKKMHGLHAELDALLDQRTQALANLPALSATDKSVLQSEGRLLKDLRDLALMDFLEYHAGTQRLWVLQNTAFLVDLAKNMSASAGSIVGLEGNHLRRSRFQGTSGVFGAITGGIVLFTPIVGRVTGNLSGMAARRLVSKELTNIEARDSIIFDRHRAVLISALSGSGKSEVTEACSKRLSFYAEEEKLMEEMNSYFANERKRARNSLIENVTFASLVGPTRVANGTLQTVGAWRYFNDTAVANKLFFAGTATYMAGTALNMLETARVQASEELRQHRLGKKQMRGRQRFSRRIERLENLERSLQ